MTTPPSKYNCNICPTKCDSKSKSAYVFKDDVTLSEEAEEWLLKKLSITLKVQVVKTPAQAHGLPDLEIRKNEKVIARVEVKAQGRAFMLIEKLLPKANLKPYETVALNLSDLLRYDSNYKIERIPTFIIWRVQRPCIGEGYGGQNLNILLDIYSKYGDSRRFQRKSTPSDYVDGQHKGVTVNYHFSIHELLPLSKLEQVFMDLLKSDTHDAGEGRRNFKLQS